MDKIAVSILLPSLNVAPFIRHCLESVCSQTLKNIEILCIDAGSTDGTLEILQEMAAKDFRIRILRSEKKSYGYQGNLGIQNAHGEYIGIVETDDFAAPDMFETLYLAAQKQQADVVKENYFHHLTQSEEDHFFENFRGLPYEKAISPKDHASLFLQVPAVWSGIYKKSFLDKHSIRFLETKGAAYQDNGFIQKVWLCAERVVLLKSAHLHYRVDNDASSSKDCSDRIFSVCDEFEDVQHFLSELPEEKKAAFTNAVIADQAQVYRWNLNRLNEDGKKAFLPRFSEDFRQLKEKGMLQFNALLDPYDYAHLLEIIDDPDSYFSRRYDPARSDMLQAENDELRRKVDAYEKQGLPRLIGKKLLGKIAHS